MWKYDYIHEKVELALESLILTEDPDDIADAFETLNRVLIKPPTIDSEQAQEWWATVCRLMETTTADEATGEAWKARATRMSRDEKREFGEALWELSGYLESEYREFHGAK